MGWETKKDSSAKDWKWWQQELGSTCGPSCVLTVAQIKGVHGNHDEASVRSLIDRADPTLRDFKGRHDWTTTGSWARALVEVLSNTFKIRNAYTTDLGEDKPETHKILGLLTKKCDYNNPGIALVTWLDGNAHWLVVCGALRNNPNKILVLDPIKGSGLVEVSSANLPDYSSPKGGIGQFSYRLITTM